MASEVSAYMSGLHKSILAQLAGPLQLPDALRLVSFLRRMGSYAPSEPELRLIFLRNRTMSFAQAEAALLRESSATYLLKYIDLCRVHWYDTITYYRVVFASDDGQHQVTMPPPSFLTRTSAATRGHKTIRISSFSVPSSVLTDDCPDAMRNLAVVDAEGVTHVVSAPRTSSGRAHEVYLFESSVPSEVPWGAPTSDFPPSELATGDHLGALLLSNWAAERVDELLRTLSAWLPRVGEGAFLANLIEQCGYACRSLSRIRCNVTTLVRAPFQDACAAIP